MKRIRNVSIETVLVFLSMGIALSGFAITVMGAFLNGWAMLNGEMNLSKGFGMILIGNSIAFSGVIMVVMIFVISVSKCHLCGDDSP